MNNILLIYLVGAFVAFVILLLLIIFEQKRITIEDLLYLIGGTMFSWLAVILIGFLYLQHYKDVVLWKKGG